MDNKIEIYQGENGQTQIEVKFEQETVWLSQKQMTELFGMDLRTINEHIKPIFNSHELEKEPTIRNFRIVQLEEKSKIERNIDHYNLDMIISVCNYSVNSKNGIKFRKWATQRLKDFLVQGNKFDEASLS